MEIERIMHFTLRLAVVQLFDESGFHCRKSADATVIAALHK